MILCKMFCAAVTDRLRTVNLSLLSNTCFAFLFQPGNSDSYNVAVKPEGKKKKKKAELDDLKKEIEFVSRSL